MVPTCGANERATGCQFVVRGLLAASAAFKAGSAKAHFHDVRDARIVIGEALKELADRELRAGRGAFLRHAPSYARMFYMRQGDKREIKLALAVASNIQIPNDLESIFERLEFFTDQDSFRVPLSRRGDGLQVRHIPHILQYISENNKGINIWAYEEPENSLEMSNAFALANEFENDFSKNNQIFITSHSPAFYSLGSERAKRFLVRKSLIKNGDRQAWVSNVEDLTSSKVADAELGVADLIAQRSSDAFEQIERLKIINAELERLHRPVVLTEGKTDVILLKAAWNKLFPNDEMPFEITSCDLGGANSGQENAGADELKKILESTTKSQQPFRIGLFDCDKKGVDCFNKLRNHKIYITKNSIKVNENKRSAAFKLPNIPWGSPYDNFISESFCIEMMFPYSSFNHDFIDFEFMIAGKKISKSKGEKWMESFSQEPELFEDIAFKVVPKFNNKMKVSEFLKNLEPSAFENFRSIFEDIHAVIKDQQIFAAKAI